MKRFLLIMLLLPLCTSCSRFRPAQLHKQTYAHASGIFTSPTIEASATLLQDTDLSSTARTITQQVVLLSLKIKNKTAQPYSIEPASCTPRPMNSQEIDALIPKSYGCYFIPASVLAFGGLLFTWQIGLPLAGLFTLFGIDQSRRAADRTLHSITIHLFDNEHSILLQPHSTTTMLVAVDRATYTPQLSFTVRAGSEQEVCSVPLYKSIDTSYTLI